MKKVACIIPNYNMPERTDALVEYINRHCADKPEIIVVNNGSEVYSEDTATLSLNENIQTTGAWLMGMQYADALERKYAGSFFGYWLIITSAEFVPESKDPLAPLVDVLEKMPHAVGVSPSLTEDSTTSWDHMKRRYTPFPESYDVRKVWMLDNICTLWRADWFNLIGRFDPRLIYAWGIDLETSYRARKSGKSLWIHEGIQVKKVTDIGYTMGRMGMPAEKRRELARENMDKILTDKYGPEWKKIMYGEYDEK